MRTELARRNRVTALVAAGAVVGMTGLAFAAVPLYRVFCQATGLAGTPAVAEAAPGAATERRITVRFDANINKALPWRFQPAIREMTVRVGEPGLAHYKAVSLAEATTTGRAVFNVTPLKAGRYFTKIDCFCFQEQRLAAGQSARMPVSFFIDPAILENPNLDDVDTITLSYSFLRAAPMATVRIFGDDVAGETARRAKERRIKARKGSLKDDG